MADQGNPSAEMRVPAMMAAAITAQRKALHAALDAPKGLLKPKAIHDLRVAIRRLLTALELAGAIGCDVEPKTARRLHKLLSRLAPARDAHVLMRALEPLRATRPEAQLVIDELKQRRRAATRKAKKRLQAFERADFDRDTALVLGALGAAPLTTAPSSLVLSALHGELAKRQLEVEQHRRGMALSDPTELHRVRVLLKQYRYALEASLPVLPEAAVGLAKLSETLQEELGRAHDAYVLAQTTRELTKSVSGADAKALADLAAELQRTEKVAHDAGARALAAAELRWPLSASLK
ncbi:MAG TPA: CHAD domain-containing protein [Polyangiaceae bacterium]|nr:CHAD domain-containing protein [Polyangiaceae bacterium]